MEPNNVMLLGFVNKAIDYLDEHVNDELDSSLSGLKNINLNSLKSELKGKLDSSLDSTDSTVQTLLHAGEDSFDRFILDNSKKVSLKDRIDKMFDVDLDTEEKVEKNRSLEDLLNYYNLNDDLLLNETKKEQFITPVKEEKIDEEKIEKEFENFVGHTKLKEETVSVNPVISDINSIPDLSPKVNEEELEKQFEDFVGYSDPFGYNLDYLNGSDNDFIIDDILDSPEEKEDETVFEMSDEDNRLLSLISQNVVKNKENNFPVTSQDEQSEKSIEDLDNIFSEVVSNEEEQPALDEIVDQDMIDNLIDYASDDGSVPPVEKNDIIKLLQDLDVSNPKNYYENFSDDKENNNYVEDSPVPANNYDAVSKQPGFVNTLIDDLRSKMIKEDEKREEIEKEYARVFEKIHKSYPYLSSNFVKSVYEMKDQIASDYPLNKKIIVLHRIIFKDVEYLRQFVEITLNHGFSMNADEDKRIVDVFKEYLNVDGKIITSIFEVANQASLLNGEYDGYRVLYIEKV